VMSGTLRVRCWKPKGRRAHMPSRVPRLDLAQEGFNCAILLSMYNVLHIRVAGKVRNTSGLIIAGCRRLSPRWSKRRSLL
jgi:hypothetical protein